MDAQTWLIICMFLGWGLVEVLRWLKQRLRKEITDLETSSYEQKRNYMAKYIYQQRSGVHTKSGVTNGQV